MTGERDAAENLFRYSGKSMWPCFQEGDILVTTRMAYGELRPGDCIVYKGGGGGEWVIHRIVSISPDIRTQGDNRWVADDEPVSPEAIAGRVTERVRYGSVSRVAGGAAGVVAGKVWRYAALLDPARDARGGRIARLIRRVSGMAKTKIPLRTMRGIRFQAGNDTVSFYLLRGSQIIGRFDPATGGWALSWPALLLIDPGKLPDPGE
jgi:signal peptidase I